jgi:hypothetical protein
MPKQPREGSVTLGGYPWLARMIDKARLEAEGTIDVFDLDFPCPMDQRLLSQLNIDAKTFQTIVVQSSTDQEILDGLAQHGVALR